jgi:hypothetical protein
LKFNLEKKLNEKPQQIKAENTKSKKKLTQLKNEDYSVIKQEEKLKIKYYIDCLRRIYKKDLIVKCYDIFLSKIIFKFSKEIDNYIGNNLINPLRENYIEKDNLSKLTWNNDCNADSRVPKVYNFSESANKKFKSTGYLERIPRNLKGLLIHLEAFFGEYREEAEYSAEINFDKSIIL